MYDAIIIGAGMSGLAAGIRLAHYDQRVCILERHSVIGGLNSFYRRGGRNYDVGLHAMTNYAPKGARGGPLGRILRQLRLAWDELSLVPQTGSSICFPGVSLRFTNDFERLAADVRRCFPRQEDGLRRLVAALCDYDRFTDASSSVSARQRVAEYVTDPMLREMLFCPILFYGGSREHDIDFGQFSILFRSIFLEGLARPLSGVKQILAKLAGRFRDLGGELRLRCGVRNIGVREDAVEKVVLDDGTELAAKRILSSAGWHETLRMCEGAAAPASDKDRLSFVESLSVLDAPPKALGHDRTIVFYNDSDTFHYQKPRAAVDLRSGMICAPSNFAYGDAPSENMVRISCLANFDHWAGMDREAYRLEKLRWFDRMAASAVRFMPDYRARVVETDLFTPVTIQRFTGHDRGAVYGAAEKRYDGTTHLKNLFICGNDQGLVGIVGTILSGISVANRHLLPAGQSG